MTARLHNNSAVVANVSSLWSLAPTDATSQWDSRVYEGPTDELVVPADATRARRWTGRVDPPAGTYRVTVWVRTPRPRGMDPGRLDHQRAHSPWVPTGRESCDSELLPGPRSCCGGNGPRPARASPRRSSSTRGTRWPAPCRVTVVWGLEPTGSPHGIPWFDHPVVPSGTATSVRIPARRERPGRPGRERVRPRRPVLPAGHDADRSGDAAPPRIHGCVVELPDRRSRRGRHVVDRIEGGRARDGRVGREQAPAGPLAVTSIAVKTTPRTGVPTTVVVAVLNTGQRPERGSVLRDSGRPGRGRAVERRRQPGLSRARRCGPAPVDRARPIDDPAHRQSR